MLKVYNTLTKQKEEFKPLKEGQVSIYVCGVTPYNHPHIGNARPFVTWDVIKRYFTHLGYKVKHIQNFTDVDDKIIRTANQEGVKWSDISTRYINSYFEVMDKLHVKHADTYPKVSQTIPEIIDMISVLIDKGYAYELNGDVYFSVEKFKGYGKLSGRKLEDMMAGARIEVNESKHNPMDFALWKAAKPGEPFWESPWGNGRPGWHIECSTMSLKYLGKTFDFHGGGSDLIFPHHENEIAQSLCMYEHNIANYWMHVGRLGLNNEKMSKSIGNVINVKDLIEQIDANAFRLFMLSVHYRQPINYTEENIQLAVKEWQKVKSTYDQLHLKLDLAGALDVEPSVVPEIEALMNQFVEALEDDFNTANAIASLYGVIKEINKMVRAKASDEANRYALMTLQNMTYIFGFDLNKKRLTDEERELMQAWEEARKAKDFAKADELRGKLQALNVL